MTESENTIMDREQAKAIVDKAMALLDLVGEIDTLISAITIEPVQRRMASGLAKVMDGVFFDIISSATENYADLDPYLEFRSRKNDKSERPFKQG